MKVYIKYDLNAACKKILQEQLEKLKLKYSLLDFNEVEINGAISTTKLKQLNTALNNYSIQIVESSKSILIQKIKDEIREMVYNEGETTRLKTSLWLSAKLKKPYKYLSSIFTEVTYTTIEKFIILQKVERAKELIIANILNFSEIASLLNYSSTAHFSVQFKNTTGLTPSSFQHIIKTKEHHPTKI